MVSSYMTLVTWYGRISIKLVTLAFFYTDINYGTENSTSRTSYGSGNADIFSPEFSQ